MIVKAKKNMDGTLAIEEVSSEVINQLDNGYRRNNLDEIIEINEEVIKLGENIRHWAKPSEQKRNH